MNRLTLQQVNEDLRIKERERERKTRGILSNQLLKEQNEAFEGTNGTSHNNRDNGFIPAYYDRTSGRSVISRFTDGRPAPIHVLDGLPEEWVAQKDSAGHVTKVRAGIVAGFLRHGRFYTREEAAKATAH